jgi:hypothetical protein
VFVGLAGTLAVLTIVAASGTRRHSRNPGARVTLALERIEELPRGELSSRVRSSGHEPGHGYSARRAATVTSRLLKRC